MKSRGMSELPPEAVVQNCPFSPAPVTVRPGQKRLLSGPEFPSLRLFRQRASRTPGVTRPTTRADCIGHSVVDSAVQIHNSMFHNILAL